MKHRSPSSERRTHQAPRSAKSKYLALAGALAAVAVAVPSGLVAVAAGGPSTAPTIRLIASDSFNRFLQGGLGKADLGGKYSVLTPVVVPVAVSAGAVSVTALKAKQSVGAWLPKVAAKNVQVQISLSVPEVSSEDPGLYFGLESRRQSDGRSYRGKIAVGAGGRIGVGLSRTAPGGAETQLGYARLNWTVTSHEVINIQTLVTGSNPTKIQVRAWPNGTNAPAWQLTVGDSSRAQVAGSGAVGEWAYHGDTKPVTAFSLRNLEAWSIAPAAIRAATSSSAHPKISASPTKSSNSTKSLAKSSASATSSSASKTTTQPSSSAQTSAPATSSANGGPQAPSALTSGRGSAPVGSAAYVIPAGALFVSPSGKDTSPGTATAPFKTVQAAVNKASSGKTIVLRAGTYHESVLVNKAGITIQSYPNETVWFDGSSVVTGWTKQASVWVHTGWTNKFDHSASFSTGSSNAAFINPAYPMAAWPDQVFINGGQLGQVSSGASAGKFSVNYGAKTLTIGSDPTGKEVRSSDLVKAFTVTGAHVTLQGFGVRRYGTPLPQMGTITMYGGSDTARNLVVSDNATQGISIGRAELIDHVSAVGNGMTGIHGNQADGSVVENSVFSGNNASHFNAAPSAAGIKITRTVGITIINNLASSNFATGIWLDESVRKFTIANNTSTGNPKGAVIELSAMGIVANNVLGGGTMSLWIMDSGDIKVFNNAFTGSTEKGVRLTQDKRRQAASGAVGRDPRMPVPDLSCPWLVRNIMLANNVFNRQGNFQFFVLDEQTHIPANKMNIVLNGNMFAAKASGTASMVAWGGSDNHSVSVYQTPAALNAAQGKSWTNLLTLSGGAVTALAATASTASAAVPIPSDVAAAIGVSTGTRRIGVL